MKAWLLDSLGGIDSLRLGETENPQPGPLEVVLALQYAALNPADRYLAEGAYPASPVFPHILGRDGLGIITLAGPGTRLSAGHKRLILRGAAGVSAPGTFAENIAVPADALVEVPAGWTDQEAAAAPLVYLTAYQALTMWADLPPQCVTLVTGASGGVGVAAVQLAKALGHTVIALSRNPDKQQQLCRLGADLTFNPADANWPKFARQQLAPRRIDLAIDNIGGAFLPDVIDSLGDNGRVSCVGRLAGPVPQFNTASLFFRRLRLGGVAVGANTPAETRAAWLKVLDLLARTGAKPLVDSIFPFDQLKQAFARLTAGPMGKVLLAIESP